jgi:type VI secretion system protein
MVRRAVPALAICLAVAGCSVFRGLTAPSVVVRSIELRVAEKANENTPIAVDLVYLSSSQALQDQVAKMTAEDWFARKDQVARDFRGELDVMGFEPVPGQVIARRRLASPKVNDAAFLFARYRTPGSHRYRLTEDDTNIAVVLGGDDFGVSNK